MSTKEIAALAKKLASYHDMGQAAAADVSLSWIRCELATQSRADMNAETVSEYESAVRAGAEMPPVDVFTDGKDMWATDGFHRIEAHERAGKATIRARVHRGDHQAAILFAVGANALHGLNRTPDDKRRAVMMLLAMPEWTNKSSREIASQAKVSHVFVEKVRKEREAEAAAPIALESTSNGTPVVVAAPKKRVDKNGNAKKMPAKKKVKRPAIAQRASISIEQAHDMVVADIAADRVDETKPINEYEDKSLSDHERLVAETKQCIEALRNRFDSWPAEDPTLVGMLLQFLQPYEKKLQERDRAEGKE